MHQAEPSPPDKKLNPATIAFAVESREVLLVDLLVIALRHHEGAPAFQVTSPPLPEGTVLLVDGDEGADDLASFIRRLREEYAAQARIVLLVSELGPRHLFDGLRAGVHGFVSKFAPFAKLVEALVQAAIGKPSLQSGAAPMPGSAPIAAAFFDRHRLARRERELLACVARGMTAKEAADELGIGHKSALALRRRLMRKLGLKSPSEFVRFVRDDLPRA